MPCEGVIKGSASTRLLKEQFQVFNGQVVPSTVTGRKEAEREASSTNLNRKKSGFLILFAPPDALTLTE